MWWLTWLLIATSIVLLVALAWLYTRSELGSARGAAVSGGAAGAFALSLLLAWLAGDYLMTNVAPRLTWIDVGALYVLGLVGGLLLGLFFAARPRRSETT